ncbi:helix-turn-helix domain-containing protein [Enterobacter sp. UNJFSC 003]|uniref:GlxA family transcriptional regulator n=1 Tax=Enterobacter sp. UNJFSC 003 TaxID=3122077 RepID=UPI002EAAAFE9|nr:helix-turn-helix domain-containing protein [Serratia liquefaciens]
MKTVFTPSGGGITAPDKRLHIGLLLWPHYSLLAVSGLMEALRYAAKAQQAISFNITLVSEFPDLPITSSAGVTIRPDSSHAPPDAFNYIAVIGGDLQSLDRGYQGDREYLAHAHHARIPLIGIGTGSFILAQEGLLNERRASIHPYHLDTFRQTFPQVYAEEGYDFIDEGDVLTCPGGISTLTLATELIRAHAGSDTASTTCQRLSLVPHEIATPRPANIALIPDSRLRRVVMLIEQFLTRPLTTAGLASEVALSERQLNRLFRAEFGKTTREFIRSARLRYACWLLKNSQQSVTDIAMRMGFSDCAHFIRHFQSEYGCTPGVWRTSHS